MTLADYTPDAVCLAMGLPGFEPQKTPGGSVVRVLLMPSFDAEVCVTLTVAEGSDWQAEVRVATSQIWSAGLAPQPVWTGAARVPAEIGSRLCRYLQSVPALDASVMIDGMPFRAAVRTPDAARDIAGVASRDPGADDLLGVLLGILHREIGDPGCARGLAGAPWHLGLELATPKPQELRPPVRIAVLGAPEERKDLLRAMVTVPSRKI